MNRIKSIFIISIFFTFLSSLSLLTIFTSKNNIYLENEKRYSADSPVLTTESLFNGEYFSDFEKYITDRIFGRSFFVASNAYLKLLEGRAVAEDIYFCKNGYLINAPKKTDKSVLTNNLDRFNQFCLSNNLKATFVLIPSPGEVMKEILPLKNVNYGDELIINEIKKYSNLLLLNPTEILRDKFNNGEEVFYKTDHHLTSLGTFYVYEQIMKTKGRSCLGKEDFSVEKYYDFYGTTWAQSGYFLTKGDKIELWDSNADLTVSVSDGKEYSKKQNSLFYKDHLKEDDKYPVFADGNHAITKIINNKKSDKNLLIIKDSYAHCLSSFLCYEYKNIYMIDLRYFRNSVSSFIDENNIDEVMFVYGAGTLYTDTNSAWLF